MGGDAMRPRASTLVRESHEQDPFGFETSSWPRLAALRPRSFCWAFLLVSLFTSASASTANAQLWIDSCTQLYSSGEWVVFEGQLSGEGAGGAQVFLTGAFDGQYASVGVDGSFYITAYLPSGAFGYAYIDAVDAEGNWAEQYSLLLDIPPFDPGYEEEQPYVAPELIAFSLSESVGALLLFSGCVQGSDVSGASVEFSGVLSGYSATADENGNFSILAEFPDGVSGDAFAQATDGRGNASNSLSTYVDVPGSSE
jgi:hypothetical protein